jgi:hypothetical protein
MLKDDKRCHNFYKNIVREGKLKGRIEMTGRRGRRRKQLLNDLKENILEIERGSNRSHCVENSLWKRLRTCRKTDCRMNSMRRGYKVLYFNNCRKPERSKTTREKKHSRDPHVFELNNNVVTFNSQIDQICVIQNHKMNEL